MGWQHRQPRAGRVHRRRCRRSSGWTSTGTRARPTPSIRTSTRSSRSGPSYVIILVGRPHLQDGLRQDARRPHRARRRADRAARSRSPWRRRAASASSRSTTDSARHRLPGEARHRRPPLPWNPDRCLGVDGHLHLRPRRSWCGCAAARRRSSLEPRLRPRHHAAAGGARASGSTPTSSGTRTRRSRSTGATSGTLDAYFEASMDLIARRSRVQPLRPGLAAAHLPAAAPAGQVRVRRGGTARRRHRVDRLDGLHRLRQRGAALDPLARACASTRTARSRTRSCMPNATVNRHARMRRAIVDRERRAAARARVIGYDPAEDRRRHTVSEGGVVVVTPGEECYRPAPGACGPCAGRGTGARARCGRRWRSAPRGRWRPRRRARATSPRDWAAPGCRRRASAAASRRPGASCPRSRPASPTSGGRAAARRTARCASLLGRLGRRSRPALP